MKKQTLKSMPYAQAYVTVDNMGMVTLVSYKTPCITVTVDGWLECSGLYSATTRRYISAFMKDFAYGDYYTAKFCYVHNMRYNINTGEVEDL